MAVTADETMTLDAVKVSLLGRGMIVTATVSVAVAPRRLLAGDPAVLLVVTDLSEWSDLEQVCALVGGVHLPAVALTTAPRGGLWGAVLEAGASIVLSAHADSDTIEATLRDASAGRRLAPAEVDDLVARWHRLREERDRIRSELDSLTVREREVLELLYDGETVADIAARLGVAQATVRSQVKSILRKLEVGSQLAAVAAYDCSLHPPPPR
ncbi:helix-turn-helix transcriptional regulator [Nocardioides albertanoniae]|uniref:helix-turn-helix transcriptional regulator n=1 Tax=Nocardioides albertanoniae TaxID=1175486 RepID=UPI001154B4E4|nr:response regulator transcription factor [Nocardioides albertanoniae]